jgi:hypothetical protein
MTDQWNGRLKTKQGSSNAEAIGVSTQNHGCVTAVANAAKAGRRRCNSRAMLR